MTPLQDVMVSSGSALGSSMVAKVSIFATYKIAFKSWCLYWFGMFVLNYDISNTICLTWLPIIYSFYHVSCLYTTKVIIKTRNSAVKGSGFEEFGSGETGSKLMLFNAYVIFSIVNTKQCLLSYRTLILAICICHNIKIIPLRLAMQWFSTSVLDTPLIIVGLIGCMILWSSPFLIMIQSLSDSQNKIELRLQWIWCDNWLTISMATD